MAPSICRWERRVGIQRVTKLREQTQLMIMEVFDERTGMKRRPCLQNFRELEVMIFGL